MSNVTLSGFPYLPGHEARHPFGRVPAPQHDDFMLYETNPIAAYVDDVFPGPKLTPGDPRKRARMNQWISEIVLRDRR